ncbi:Apolipoprotein M [Chelonia mydas]|uniref:Apolipoprotein M n=1 Tax=Chelonia mydas TaxID=8469 RepID=M7BVA7_CHEMY|nr:Apolipoprotein M [Chelonia mydas]
MRTELFSSKCPDTIIVQESDRDYQRILLYSRTPHLADECIEDFRNQAYCLDMEEFLLIPRSQARTPHLADECIEDFRNQAYCLDMEEFLLIPRSQVPGATGPSALSGALCKVGSPI